MVGIQVCLTSSVPKKLKLFLQGIKRYLYKTSESAFLVKVVSLLKEPRTYLCIKVCKFHVSKLKLPPYYMVDVQTQHFRCVKRQRCILHLMSQSTVPTCYSFFFCSSLRYMYSTLPTAAVLLILPTQQCQKVIIQHTRNMFSFLLCLRLLLISLNNQFT